ncbi:hypothetical protein RSJ44_000111 [Yersinia enterocolitica]|uniref:hypothetical protein n=2 Tax=Yersinia enterocolitica TaxID=630 RepID=UPI0028BB2D5B|nr:hypothetical protein [Yersinia enterocolitica]EKN3983742.1 hypothetical protein [Yersinia enterocolitica]EKN5942176.1 hypothetical protein [Yersinia enterocolitica]EKN6221594.1 hypothetical protein [Yersinia enterocolitica]ELI8403496.1 hypothetical protein [Yersinia enterocolitica]
MGLVSYVSRGIHAAKELINHDPNDKSFLKATPEVFSENEGVVINNLISCLNKEEKDKTVSDKLSVPIEIDKMVNKSKEHLDFFLLKAQKEEGSCSYLIERACFNQYKIEFKNEHEAKEHLSYYAIKTITNDILKKINPEIDSSDSLLDTEGDVSHKAKEYLSPQICKDMVVRLLNADIGDLKNIDKDFCTDITDKPYDSMASILADYINNHASYTVGPEKFSDLLMAYYDYNAGKFDFPSAAQLKEIGDKAVKKFEFVKLYSLNMLEDLLKQSDGTRDYLYIANRA